MPVCENFYCVDSINSPASSFCLPAQTRDNYKEINFTAQKVAEGKNIRLLYHMLFMVKLPWSLERLF